MGAGLATAQKNAANYLRMSTPLGIFYCPTRRRPLAYPWTGGAGGAPILNAGQMVAVGRSDYAANGGDIYLISLRRRRSVLAFLRQRRRRPNQHELR